MKFHPGALLLALALAAALVVVALLPPAAGAGPGAALEQALPATGAMHAVTGVLLGFRAYDTLLEIFVLLLAALAADTARAAPGRRASQPGAHDPAGPVMLALVGVVAPAMVLVAGYFLWAGTHAPGGAFQAAAVLAASGVLLRLAGVVPALDPGELPVRLGLAGGPAFFLAVFASGALPEMLLAVEAALALSIGLALFCLFAAPER